ncbi:9488_t:CDS:10 [Paraglomus occultum]|uniref:9488_t:CDS:1 n=1 Tax=Paraglomus occultum TaxID=144539 RepID=A0A9N9GPG2_9GLOM|nr:9488_t:CDS:10 [Paraglomus occultum]
MATTNQEKFFEYVEKNQEQYVQRLREAVAIPSVSSDAAYREHVFKMGEYLGKLCDSLGISYEARDVGTHEMDGKTLQLPPIILGTYGNDPNKPTILVYGHYDVQPALLEDGWSSDPWVLTEDSNGRLMGRGATDDKGPVLTWFNIIEAHQKLGLELPVNLKMCFEGMEENGSEGLDDLIQQEADKYFKGVDAVCISDNYWLGISKPCLTYGLRGISYFKLTVSGPGKDLHSGVFGGTVYEPMTDLIYLMGKLVKPDGTILVPGIYDNVAELAEEEKAIYGTIDFKMHELHSAIESDTSIHANEPDTLMHRWRYPSLSIHGIEGAFSAPGAKTVIPAKVHGKFSIRSVPNMDPERITELVTKYLNDEFAKLGTKNKMTVECIHAAKSWVSSPDHWNYVAAAKATETVFNVKPDLTREGGSIPVTLTFQDALKTNVLLLPVGRGDDGAHSINEKLDRSNLVSGTKLLGAYLYEVAAIERK